MGESRGLAQRYVVENDQKVIVRRREQRIEIDISNQRRCDHSRRQLRSYVTLVPRLCKCALDH